VHCWPWQSGQIILKVESGGQWSERGTRVQQHEQQNFTTVHVIMYQQQIVPFSDSWGNALL